MKRPTAIITADMHAGDSTPVCRTDDYQAAFWKKVAFVDSLQEKYKCPILDAGDLLNKWRPSNSLLVDMIKRWPEKFYTVPGNHDLPSHNLSNLPKSGLAVLEAAGALELLSPTNPLEFHFSGLLINVYGIAWGQEEILPKLNSQAINVVVLHTDIYKGKLPWPGCTFPDAEQVMKRFNGFSLIVTGHNHQPFTLAIGGRLLVNPGSLMRRNADQITHIPRVYLWFAKDNKVDPVHLPIEEEVVTREHLEVIENRNERIDAFVARITQDYEVGLSFEKNMEKALNSSKIKKPVKTLILQAMGLE